MKYLSCLLLLAAAPSVRAQCPLFPATNVWNTPVDSLPVSSKSSTYVAIIGSDKPLHPDFGSGGIGIPFILVAGNQAKVPVAFEYGDESDHADYPIPADAPIEGGADSSG